MVKKKILSGLDFLYFGLQLSRYRPVLIYDIYERKFHWPCSGLFQMTTILYILQVNSTGQSFHNICETSHLLPPDSPILTMIAQLLQCSHVFTFFHTEFLVDNIFHSN